MREALDPWFFVDMAYAIVIASTVVLAVWNWLAMRAAERRRDKGRRK